jgi:integrase
MPTIRLRTEAPSLTCPADKTQVYYTDIETQRLRLRVARSGRHVWDWRCAERTEVLGVYDTTGTSGLTYQEAKARADRLNAALDRGHSVEAAIATPPQVQTVGKMMDYYLENKVRDTTRVRRQKETYRGTQSAIKPLLARHSETRVIDMNREMLLRVVRDAGLAGLVAGVKLVKIYRAAWNYCHRSDVLAKLDRDGAPLKNPASNFVLDERELRVKFRGTYATSLSDEQIVALLRGIERGKAAWDGGRRARAGIDEIPMRWPLGYLAVEFLIHTGCRKMEAETLHVTDIVGDVARIVEHKTDHTGKIKEIHLSPSALRVLAEAARLREKMRYTGPLVFPGQSGGQITAIADCLDTACQIAGIRRLIPHNLRSIYINFAVRSGTPIEIVSKNVGHENLLTTRRHYEAVEREIRAQHAHAASAAIDRLLAEADQQVA